MAANAQKAVRIVAIVALLGSLAAFVSLFGFGESVTGRTTMGAPVVASSASGERIVFITSHWVTRRLTTRSLNKSYSTTYYVEAWGLDAKTLEVAWRSELKQIRSGERSNDSQTYGAWNGHIWHYDDGLWGIAVADGGVAISPEKLTAANPELAPVMPDDPKLVTFDGEGPLVRTLNGRTWRVDPATARLVPGTKAPDGAGAMTPAADNLDTYLRTIANGRWYGFLRERDVAFVKENGVVHSSYWMQGGNGMDWGNLPDPRTLYSAAATVKPGYAPEHWAIETGPVEPWGDMPPLLFAEFLRPPGLFSSHDPTVLTVPGPDSFIVVGADIGGDRAALVFARVGFDGKLLWLTPTNIVRHWVTMTDNYLRPEGAVVVLHNVVISEEEAKEKRDIFRDWPKAVVRIDLATGAVIQKRLDELPYASD